MAEKQTTAMSAGPHRASSDIERAPWSDVPFSLVRRLADEVDQLFEGFGVLPDRLSARLGRTHWRMFPARRHTHGDFEIWTPDVDMFQQGHDLVLRVDLPGLKKDEINLHVADDAVAIRGERREQTGDGIYRRERSFGTIELYIPLPEGAFSEQAKASFQNGVLEIVMPAPPEHVTRGRRLEISDGSGNSNSERA